MKDIEHFVRSLNNLAATSPDPKLSELFESVAAILKSLAKENDRLLFKINKLCICCGDVNTIGLGIVCNACRRLPIEEQKEMCATLDISKAVERFRK